MVRYPIQFDTSARPRRVLRTLALSLLISCCYAL